MEIFIVVAVALAIVGKLIHTKIKRRDTLKAWLVDQGLTPEYSYGDRVGIDSKAGKAFIYAKAPTVLNQGDVRSIEILSTHETKHNAWGMAFHKDKNCRLVFHTHSMDQPMQTISFGNKADMDIWFSRLCLFFKLT
jgi:hypothetical protein